METKPKIKIESTIIDKFLELLGWLTIIILWVLTIWSYFKLPDIIPIHYDSFGNPDDYGNRLTIFILPLVASVIFAGMTIINKYPHIFIYPVDITKENALKQYTNATRLLRFLKFSIPFIFLIIIIVSIDFPLDNSDGLGIWFIPVTLGIIIIPLIVFFLKSFKHK
jgi:uncharacterized membrane protein